MKRYHARQSFTHFTVLALRCVAAAAQPVCSPRGASDSSRLNVTLDADRYGVVLPCHGHMIFYIARNTELRGLEGRFDFGTQTQHKALQTSFSVELDGPSGGLFRGSTPMEVMDNACRKVSVRVWIHQCRNNLGAPIDCPIIRVLRPESFGELAIFGDTLDICFD